MPNEPAQFSTNAGTLIGPIDGKNRVFSFAPLGSGNGGQAADPDTALPGGFIPGFDAGTVEISQGGLIFQNGHLLTQPFEGVALGDVVTLATAPQPGSVVTVQAWSPDSADPFFPALNLPVQFSTADGSIIGTLDGQNNVFTLKTASLVTGIILFWNGGDMVLGADFTWTCQQPSSAGGWVTTITLMAGNYPLPADTLTAAVFES